MDLIEKESVEELFHAQAHIWNHLFCFINSMSLRCAVQLCIPDIVHNHHQPITLFELVMKLAIPKTKIACLVRLMHLLVHSGFFAIQKVCNDDQQEEGYVLAPSSRLLLRDHPKSLSPLVALLDPIIVTPSYFLSAWFQWDSPTPFEAAHGKNIWDYARQDIEFNNFLNKAMASDARLVTSVVVTECKGVFEGLRSLVDIGGGTGTVAKTIAKNFPSLKCIVFDLPHVVTTMKADENLTYVAGDMFESIPHADAILLMILHDWNDEQCIKILKGCKEAISSGGESGNPRKDHHRNGGGR